MKLNEKNETEYHKKIDILGAPCFKERKMRLYMALIYGIYQAKLK
jgi:hypothetical protein